MQKGCCLIYLSTPQRKQQEYPICMVQRLNLPRLKKHAASLLWNIYAIVWLFVVLCAPLAANATKGKQVPSGKPKVDLSSPYATVQTHFMFLSPGNESLMKKVCMVFIDGEMNPDRNKKMAIQLKRLLTIKGVQIQSIQQDPNYIDPTFNEHRYTITKKLPYVYLIKNGKEWRYSKETIDFVLKKYKPIKLHRLCYYVLPKAFCKKTVLDIAIWQYVIFASLILMIWLLHKTMPYFFKFVIFKFVKGSQRKQFSIERLLFVLIAIWLLRAVLPMLHFEHLETLVNRFLEAATSFLCMCLAFEYVGVMQEKIKITYQENKFTIHMLPLYSMIVKIFIILYGIIKIVDNFGFATESMVQVLSFSTLGLGLASQDIIKNLFGSFMIIMDRPFSVGDDIAAGTIRGKVEEIGLRATLLRTREGTLVYIPNAKLADAFIDNFGKRSMRMISLEIPLGYDVPLGILPQFIRGLRGITKRQPFIKTDRTSLYLDKMTEDGFVIVVELFLDTTKREIENECKNNVISFILKLAQHLGIGLGKVKHVVHIETPTISRTDTDAPFLARQDIENLFQETKDD